MNPTGIRIQIASRQSRYLPVFASSTSHRVLHNYTYSIGIKTNTQYLAVF